VPSAAACGYFPEGAAPVAELPPSGKAGRGGRCALREMWKGRIFFGWYVVGLALMCLLLGYGVRHSFGVFFSPMLKEFEWSRTVLSGAQSTGLVVNAVFAPVFGVLVDRYGPRWLITGGAFLVGTSMVLMGHVSHPWQFYVLYGFVLALGINGMGVVVNNTMVTNWFVRKRGLAVAIPGAGTGLGITVMSLASSALIGAAGWRTAFVVLGIALMGCLVPLGLAVAKRRPEEVGLMPDGWAPGADGGGGGLPGPTAVGGESAPVERGLPPGFWRLFAAYTAFSVSWYLLTAHQVPYAADLGIGRPAAARAFALVGATSVAGLPLFGLLSDRLRDRKYAVTAGLLVYTSGYVLLLSAGTAGDLYLAAVALGFGYGGVALMSALCGDHFGRFYMGRLFGFVATGGAVGGALGPLLGGLVYDLTGNYRRAWEAGVGLCIMAALFLLGLGRPACAVERPAGGGRPGPGRGGAPLDTA